MEVNEITVSATRFPDLDELALRLAAVDAFVEQRLRSRVSVISERCQTLDDLLVGCLANDTGQADAIRTGAEEAQRPAVEGADKAAAQRLSAEQLFDPLAHLLCRFVGEGESNDLMGMVNFCQESQETTGEQPGLTRACWSLEVKAAVDV